MTDRDTIIVIGAGAAGLAAARELHDSGRPVTVLEARDRVGGRAWTSYEVASHPVELGAEFMHGENIVTWRYLERYGLTANDQVTVMNVRGYMDGQFLEQRDFLATTGMRLAIGTAEAAQRAARDGADRPLTEAVAAWAKALGLTPSAEDWRLWRSYVAQFFAADPEEIGSEKFVESTYEGDGDRLQYRVIEGYSTLMDRIAEGLDVRLSTPVTRVEWSLDGAVVNAAGGATFEARAVIVTLPLAILQAGDVVFDPPLPPQKIDALRGLGSGATAKIILRFDEPVWPEDTTMILSSQDSGLWWRPGRCRDDEDPVITAFFGGSAVERFRSLGEGAPIEAIRHLEVMLGLSGLERRLVTARFVDWPADPWAKMSYSYTPPGGAGKRALLASPVDSVLLFAGEATNAIRPSCVHGAIESGLRAAAEVQSA